MAKGVSGYLDFAATKDFVLRVHYEETYDVASNTSQELKITGLQVSPPHAYGVVHYLDGTISIGGNVVITLNSQLPTHKVYLGAAGTFCDVTGTLGSVSGIVHESDGTKKVTISVSVHGYSGDGLNGNGWFANGSQTIALTTIPRASAITSAGNVTLGNGCSIKWTPKAAAFRYKLKFSLGSWSHTTDAIHPNKTTEHTYSGYPIPLEVAEQIPEAKTGTMKVELYTYSDGGATVQVGSDSETFTVTVPDNDSTKPAVTMELSPVSALASKFAGLYIQGKTKVKANLSAEGKFKASISSYSMKAEGNTYGAGDNYVSDYLNTAGKIPVYGYATDSRGFTGSTPQEITVIGYSGPKILAASGESGVVAARCDEDGNLCDDGTYLKIKAKRSYSPVASNGVQKNFCQIRFRYKLETASNYSDWTTILEGSNLSTDEIVTGALLGGVLSTTSSYLVQIQAVDDIGENATTTVPIMTEVVYMHRSKNAMGLGKYCERENAIDSGWDLYMNRNRVTGLPAPIDSSDAVPKSYVDEIVSGGGGISARIGEVTLLASAWMGTSNPYSQVVTINGVTECSQVDLTPSVEQLAIFYNKDLAFVTENEDGVVTVYAIGQKPENDYIIQVTITEVSV